MFRACVWSCCLVVVVVAGVATEFNWEVCWVGGALEFGCARPLEFLAEPWLWYCWMKFLNMLMLLPFTPVALLPAALVLKIG